MALAAAGFYLSYSLASFYTQTVSEVDLPTNLNEVKLSQGSKILDAAGNRIGEFSSKQRYWVSISQLPQSLRQAFLAVEDAGFYGHIGISPMAIARATLVNLRKGGYSHGASTITQQLVRRLYLTPEKTLKRKLREAVLAIEMERRFGKDQLFELYLNEIYLGNNSYGVEAAAQNYFRKPASELNVAESAMIAGLAKAPSKYAPHRFFSRARERQLHVLERMVEEGYLRPQEAKRWKRHGLKIEEEPLRKSKAAPYFLELLRKNLRARFEFQNINAAGLQFHTSLDSGLQRRMKKDFEKGLARQFHDLASDQLQAAFVVLGARSGDIKALSGGLDFSRSQFNLAIQTKRPLGSLFMPFYYALALERGYDLNQSIFTRGKPAKLPPNDMSLYGGLHGGFAPESARLFSWLGIGTVARLAKQLGFRFRRADLSLALGRGRASLLQVLSAYSALANGGERVVPRLLARLTNGSGQEVYRASPSRGKAVLNGTKLALVNHVLREVGKSYLGEDSKIAMYVGSDRALHDAWVVGFDRNNIVGMWVGSVRGRVRLAKNEGALRRRAVEVWQQLCQSIVFEAPDVLLPAEAVFRPLAGSRRFVPVILR